MIIVLLICDCAAIVGFHVIFWLEDGMSGYMEGERGKRGGYGGSGNERGEGGIVRGRLLDIN